MDDFQFKAHQIFFVASKETERQFFFYYSNLDYPVNFDLTDDG